MKKVILILFVFTSLFIHSQNNKDTIYSTLKGQILDVKTRFPLKSAHILNLTTVKGTTTNSHGRFEIKAKKGDEIYISYIGYESIKLIVTNDLLNDKDLKIGIHDRIVPLDVVEVKSHKLIGILAVDAKNVPKTTPNRVHINGLPQTYETGLPKARNYNSALAAVFSPIDFWYQKLGKKPKELKKLNKLRKDDKLREIMEQKFNREVMLQYLDMSRNELNQMLKDCNYSKRFIKKASDLQIVDAILNCYENQKIQNKGKVKKEMKHYNEERL
jgi:hypothetical protein